MTAGLEQLIRLAILTHNAEHAGEFLDCPHGDCRELRLDLVQLVQEERQIERLREAMVNA